MGVFFEPSGTTSSVRAVLTEALGSPAVADAEAEADKRLASMNTGASLQASRLVIATLMVAVVVAAAVYTDIKGYDDSSKALFGFAATLFGVIVGLLGGEKSGS